MMKPSARTLAYLTPVFILLAHYLAVFPHELAHSFTAWALGRKVDPLAITWGGDSLRNIILLSHIDENVDYPSIFARGPAYYAAYIAFAGPGIVNGGLYLMSLGWLKGAWLRTRPIAFYFMFWFNFMNLANIYDYIPIRTFSAQDDVANFVRGLGVSPWYVYCIGSYLVGIAIVDFLRCGLPRAYYRLGLSTASQCCVITIGAAILFWYFSVPGFYAGDTISFFIAVTSWMIVPGVLYACWPSRQWVQRRVLLQASLSNVLITWPGESGELPNTSIAST